MSFPRYSKYKDSDVHWIGNVPEHWDVSRLKNIFIIQKRIAGKLGLDVLSITNKGIKVKDIDSGDGQLSNDYSKYQLVLKGDFAMNHMDLLTGYVDISAFDGVTSPDYRVFTMKHPDLDEPKYLLRLLQNAYHQKLFFPFGQGSAHLGRWRLPAEEFKDFFFPRPPNTEQSTIARFLDHETAKIDALIREQERLIELLQEKRQAVISHAVTKGLDPDVPMKDSGVKWLGEVPAHWKVVRLKHVKSHRPNAFVDGPFGSNLKSSHFIEEGDAYVIESNFATTGRLENTKLKQISLEHFRTIQRSETQGGDIIIAKIGARYGMCSILPTLDKPAVVSGNSLKLTINQDICDPIFATLVLRYLRERGAIEDIVNMTAQPALSLGELNNLPFPLPSLAEQNEILVSVQGQLTKFTSLTEECSRVIHLLYERRSALISAAVTGKIDVRNWEPPADESAFGEEVRQAGMEATA